MVGNSNDPAPSYEEPTSVSLVFAQGSAATPPNLTEFGRMGHKALINLIARETAQPEETISDFVDFLTIGNDEPIRDTDDPDALEELNEDLGRIACGATELFDPTLGEMAAVMDYATLDYLIDFRAAAEKLAAIQGSCGFFREEPGHPATELLLAKVRSAAMFVRDHVGMRMPHRIDDEACVMGSAFWTVCALLMAAEAGCTPMWIAGQWTDDQLGHNLIGSGRTQDEMIEQHVDPLDAGGF